MDIYLQIIIGVCAVAFTAGTAYSQFKKGDRSGSTEIINFYKGQASDYKDMVAKKDEAHSAEVKTITADFNDKIINLTKDLAALRSQYIAEKAQREQYEAILKDKNPETEQFMKLMIKSVEDQGKINKEVVSLLSEIYKMSKDEHERDFNITAQITKT